MAELTAAASRQNARRPPTLRDIVEMFRNEKRCSGYSGERSLAIWRMVKKLFNKLRHAALSATHSCGMRPCARGRALCTSVLAIVIDMLLMTHSNPAVGNEYMVFPKRTRTSPIMPNCGNVHINHAQCRFGLAAMLQRILRESKTSVTPDQRLWHIYGI